ncbi:MULTISPECIES: transcriptional regulator [unclassified Gordonia (in: high G+C Gram-positive bacteria)]|uniref:transcriptional regulator n=1 Tax=unclassified Gordonia (in: high G+C Gram-positive bacteria) TaxID=2657482 RepID=UPI001F10ABE3|nr:transcriptional regulator [Gordonia sp. ABSL49_1]MCH5645434.1 transcriptional regulator [Gordonia sp. ABSL49_1]
MSTSPRRTHRPALIVLVAVAALACLALAWWQWDRYESSSGTAQNLGYALQWPAFAVAVIYAYRRFVVLERAPEEERTSAARSKGATEIPDGLLPKRPTTPSASSLSNPPDAGEDKVLADYNRYLAELDSRDDVHEKGPL